MADLRDRNCIFLFAPVEPICCRAVWQYIGYIGAFHRKRIRDA